MITKLLKRIIPQKLKKFLLKLWYIYKKLYIYIEIKEANSNHKKAIDKLKNHDRIKIAFFLINVDTWKLDSLYWAFSKHKRFEPIIIICPFISKGQSFLNAECKKGIEYCNSRNYDYFVAYNMLELEAIDIKQKIKPDIVFFTNPNNLTSKELLIDNYLDTLTCYVPYSFRIDTLYEYEYNNRLVNLVWLNFYETAIHKHLASSFAKNKGRNVVVSGFPFLDDYNNVKPKEQVWKHNDKYRKKIIWAPHWTIRGFQETGLDWACFLDYYKVFLDLAIEYKDEIQFAMKPHPFLKSTLSQEDLWGVKKTEEYFNKWNKLNNCQVIDGDYKQLFIQSDAMIHDSGSFMTEYLALNKPMAYTISDSKSIGGRFNKFGEFVFKAHYLIDSEKDLRMFINNLINGKDILLKEREKIIFEQNLNRKKSISEDIVKQINIKLS